MFFGTLSALYAAAAKIIISSAAIKIINPITDLDGEEAFPFNLYVLYNYKNNIK